MKLLLLLKIILTVFIGIALLLPFYRPSAGSGFLIEMQLLGVTASLFLAAFFLILIFFYCKDLQQTLELVEPENRHAKPKSVWLMFLIPYNFIEDFFIVYNVAKSLKNNEKHHVPFNQPSDYGLYTGLGWCAAQIISLFPGMLGKVAGLLAIILWVIHWRFIRSVIKALNHPSKLTQPVANASVD